MLAWQGIAMLMSPAGIAFLGNAGVGSGVTVLAWATKRGLSKEVTTGLEMLSSASGLPVTPKSWYTMSVRYFYAHVILAQANSCQSIVNDFASLPSSLSTLLLNPPDFTRPNASDCLGVRNGRHCAAEGMTNRSYGVGLGGCIRCCEKKLTKGNGLIERLPYCKAVCIAQFGPGKKLRPSLRSDHLGK